MMMMMMMMAMTIMVSALAANGTRCRSSCALSSLVDGGIEEVETCFGHFGGVWGACSSFHFNSMPKRGSRAKLMLNLIIF